LLHEFPQLSTPVVLVSQAGAVAEHEPSGVQIGIAGQVNFCHTRIRSEPITTKAILAPKVWDVPGARSRSFVAQNGF
jgi:hypothetical protein